MKLAAIAIVLALFCFIRLSSTKRRLSQFALISFALVDFIEEQSVSC